MRVIISGWLLRAVLAAIFLYAGIAKLVDVRTFAADVANYRLLPSPLVAPLAATLPGVEIACGLGLLHPRSVRAAAVLATALLAAFTIAAAQALARDINLDCGCFGSVRAPVTVLTVGRDAALVAAAVAIAALTPSTNEKAPRARGPGG
ncbi:MAG: DoxX family membrane protein [Deltaproteobacteria bacterium]|nr:MAG: DoxX family membrane protein [Deltaproteobacteria bacterium]